MPWRTSKTPVWSLAIRRYRHVYSPFRWYSANTSTTSSNTSKITSSGASATQLTQIKSLFPDINGLHARVDSLIQVANGDTLGPQIAFVPLGCRRQDISSLLNALLIDPLASDQTWYDAVSSRTLSKDVVVRYSPTFDYIGTFNSMAEYPVPFRNGDQDSKFANFNFIEANSIVDSWENIKSCHLVVFVTKNFSPDFQPLDKLPPIEYPSVVVLDRTATEPEPTSSSSVIQTNSLRALDAMIELRESRARAGACVAQYERNMGQLESRLESPAQLYNDLLRSVVDSCEKLMPDSSIQARAEQGLEEMKHIRTNWSEHAHRELQTTLLAGLDNLEKTSLAWWTLYFRVDDVYDRVCATLYESFLPKSKNSLLYYMGRIDIQAKRDYGYEPEQSSGAAGESAITKTRDSLINGQAVATLHNQALKILTTNLFLVQMPFLFIPLLGVYFYGYSLYAMGSLIGLGLVVGLARIQKQWANVMSAFKSDVAQSARVAITTSEEDLWARYEHRVIDQQSIVAEKRQLVDSLKCI